MWLYNTPGPYFNFVGMMSVGVFFMNIGMKIGRERQPDARRRLKLLMYGVNASMMPLFGYVLYTGVLKRPAESVPPLVRMRARRV